MKAHARREHTDRATAMWDRVSDLCAPQTCGGQRRRDQRDLLRGVGNEQHIEAALRELRGLVAKRRRRGRVRERASLAQSDVAASRVNACSMAWP